jgi:hypothetical protein
MESYLDEVNNNNRNMGITTLLVGIQKLFNKKKLNFNNPTM